MRNRELDTLTKRNQQIYDQYTRCDIECKHALEDLLSANGRIEQLRNECANLRAEKAIWGVSKLRWMFHSDFYRVKQGIQTRLVDENKTLALERSHLSDLIVNVQKMHNDLERSGENDRRRLETQMQMLETQW
jgi:nucleoprotein TPR